MLQPARQKFRKMQKGRNKGIATTGNKVSFGEYGLKAVGRGRLTARQIEAARRVMTRHIKRGGRVWIRIFPDQPISKKPAEVRMGNGKGPSGADLGEAMVFRSGRSVRDPLDRQRHVLGRTLGHSVCFDMAAHSWKFDAGERRDLWPVGPDSRRPLAARTFDQGRAAVCRMEPLDNGRAHSDRTSVRRWPCLDL